MNGNVNFLLCSLDVCINFMDFSKWRNPKREEVEVRGAKTLTVMNGGKMEPNATVNLQYRKDIWGGKIQSLHCIVPSLLIDF